MTHLDLFSGIGGFHLAADWAGLETIGFSEVEPYCCKLLTEKWPEIPNYGDIRRADFSGLRDRVTVLSAGVPCQPASLVGKRRGAGDDRWLWPATLDVVESVQPTWCIFENPPGILTLDEFGGVLLRLESLGYQVRAFSVPANAVGAKHQRQRVFIVANTGSQRFEERQECDSQPEQSGFEASCRHDFKRCDPNATIAAREQMGMGGQSRKATASFRLTEPPLCRRANGVQNRSHRLKALGNAVVPQQAYPFFAAIAQVEDQLMV